MISLEKTQLLQKHSKRIRAARVVIFGLASLCLLIAVFSFVLFFYTSGNNTSLTPVYSFGGIGLLYLIMGIISKTKPIIPYSIAGGINIFLFICMLASPFMAANNLMISTYVFLILIQFLITFFFVRGAVSARKSKKLLLATDTDS